MGFEIAPSLICFDFLRLKEQFFILQKHGISNLHVDVMDGVFVEQITIGEDFVRQIKNGFEGFFLDVHLMVINPITKVKTFVEAGAGCITFHVEACKSLEEIVKCCEEIKKNGAKCGIVLNPEIDVEIVEEVLKKTFLDKVLIMSVKAGLSGQKFIENTFLKLQKLDEILRKLNLKDKIEVFVDGGINLEVLPKILQENINGAVVGSALHKIKLENQDRILNFEKNLADFRNVLSSSEI